METPYTKDSAVKADIDKMLRLCLLAAVTPGTLMFARSLQNYWSKKGKLSLRQYDVLKSMYDELKGNQ